VIGLKDTVILRREKKGWAGCREEKGFIGKA